MRTGADHHIHSLHDGRQVYLDRQVVDDVVEHPAYRNAVRSVARLLLGLAAWFLLAGPMDASAFQLIRTEEASIADIQAALQARTLTCRALVQMYLDRIEAYDKKGPALNAIVAINAD